MHLTVRSAGEPLDLAAAVRRQVQAVDPYQSVFNVRTMEQRLAESLAARRFQMWLFGLFALVAMALAAVGVYGVISYAVSARTHEIGVRLALGAQPRHVLWMVVRQELTLAFVGMALGVVLALASTRLMTSLLFNVKPTDPVTFASITLLLSGVALLAAYLPARRATKVNPIIALRHE